MQKWKYFVVWIDISASSSLDQADAAGQLNHLGQDGWELTGIVQDEIGR